MCAYNAVRGDPACANPLLYGTLRDTWGFGATRFRTAARYQDIMSGHAYVAIFERGRGIGREGGNGSHLWQRIRLVVRRRYETGLIAVAEIDRALERLFTARFELGMFDPPAMVPWS